MSRRALGPVFFVLGLPGALLVVIGTALMALPIAGLAWSADGPLPKRRWRPLAMLLAAGRWR